MATIDPEHRVYGVRIVVGREPLLTESEYRAADAALWAARVPGEPVGFTAQMARTVASWWMAPDTELSRFVHTGEADGVRLSREIQRELYGPHAPAHGSDNRGDLLALLGWVAQEKFTHDKRAAGGDRVNDMHR